VLHKTLTTDDSGNRVNFKITGTVINPFSRIVQMVEFLKL